MPVEQGGLHLIRDLEQRLPDLLMPDRAELPFEAGVDVPSPNDLRPGAYEVVKTVINDFGNAKILGEGAFDFPIVDASASEDRYRALMAVAGFTLNFQAERREEYSVSNSTLRAREYDIKMGTCIRAIQEKRDRIAAYGESSVGATGLLNNGNITVDNNSFDPYGANASTLSAFFISLARDFNRDSETVYKPDKALVSTALFYRMLELNMPDSGLTVKDHLEKALSTEGTKFEIRQRRHCDSANLERNKVQSSGTNKDRIVFYKLNPRIVERHVEKIQFATRYIQIRGLDTLYPMFGCTTPTIVHQTTGISYTDVVKG